MSFASETKNELARITPAKKCCTIAEIAGFMRFAGSIGLAGGGKFRISMTTPNNAVVRHYKSLIVRYFKVETDIEVGQGEGFGRGKQYTITIDPDNKSEMILREAGILMVREGMNSISDGIYDGLIRTKCCRKAYLRGAFLAAGTVASPDKSYHLEISTSSELLARDLRRLINTFDDITPKIVARKKGFGVYLKAREEIADALAIMGANGQYFAFQDVMMKKDLMNQAHRAENLDNANIDKAIRAAEEQVAWIRRIDEKQGLASLSAKLQEVARMRLEHPDAGLEELGQMLTPPLSKSGVNGRLRRIGEIARGL
ncbi:MAG: DNA-binding protein WhiA [Firmicutes bacterium]|nr:DNA-binding protein WhiA [Bacillota bacterium]